MMVWMSTVSARVLAWRTRIRARPSSGAVRSSTMTLAVRSAFFPSTARVTGWFSWTVMSWLRAGSVSGALSAGVMSTTKVPAGSRRYSETSP